MPFELIYSFPWWFIIFCILAGISYAFLLYRKNHALPLSPFWIWFLAALRFSTVSLLALLLLGPYVKSLSRTVEKPVVIFAQDNSSSIALVHDSLFLDAYRQSVADVITALSGKFDIKQFSFGEEVREQADWKFNESRTDFSVLKEQLTQRFANLNVGALILASDGIYNRGNNPYYDYRSSTFPVYTIALGDTVQRKDLLISSVQYNKQVSAGSRFMMECLIAANDALGSTAQFTIENDTGVVFSRLLTIGSKHYTQKIPVSFLPSGKGIVRYRIKISRQEGEITYQNNEKVIYVEVTEMKYKILLLATSPHPDVSVLRAVAESNPNYEFTFSVTGAFIGSLKSYSLIIFHQCPAHQSELALAVQAIEENLPVWFITGAQTSVSLFNQLQTGIRITNSRPGSNEVLASFHSGFSAFSISDQMDEVISGFPPLLTPFGNYQPVVPLQVLFYQRIGNVMTQQPLLAFNQSTSKIAVLTGEGLWKWRLAEFNSKGNTDKTHEIISRTIQYLLHDDKKYPLRVFYKKEYESGEPLIFDAELYNPAGEITTENDISMTITGQNGSRYEFQFSKTENGGFALNAGRMEPGSYRFKARSKSGDTPVTYEGEFLIGVSDVELLNSQANHQLLYALSKATGGKMYEPDQLNRLAEELLQRDDIKPVAYSEIKLRELIDMKWIFYLCVLLLAVEWFTRKRSGSY